MIVVTGPSWLTISFPDGEGLSLTGSPDLRRQYGVAVGGSAAYSIFRTAGVVGDAWSWLVMREAVLHGVSRFAEFQTRLGTARSTLSARLTQLTTGGLLTPGPGYHLTKSGRDFLGCLVVAMRWGDQW